MGERNQSNHGSKKAKQQNVGFRSLSIVCRPPYFLIGVLGWNKILIRELWIFIVFTGVVGFLVYGSLMPYPSTWGANKNTNEKKVGILNGKPGDLYVRIFLLVFAVFIVWSFTDFVKDMVLIIDGKNAYESTEGEITSAETIWGSAPFYQNLEMDGNTSENFSFYLPFAPRYLEGTECEFAY